MDEELEDIKRKKLEELKRQMQSQEAQDDVDEQMEAQIKSVLRTAMTPEARERLARVRLARPDIAESIEQQIVMLAQRGAIRDKVDDATLKKLLAKITSRKKDIKIERR